MTGREWVSRGGQRGAWALGLPPLAGQRVLHRLQAGLQVVDDHGLIVDLPLLRLQPVLELRQPLVVRGVRCQTEGRGK